MQSIGGFGECLCGFRRFHASDTPHGLVLCSKTTTIGQSMEGHDDPLVKDGKSLSLAGTKVFAHSLPLGLRFAIGAFIVL